MGKSVNNNTVFFLVAVLIAGIIAISFQSFIDTEASGDKREHHDKHKYYKSNDPSVIVKKITCNNLNVNINGLRMDISPDDIASELSTQAQTNNNNNNDDDISANSLDNGKINNLYKDNNDLDGFIYICIDNINAQDSSAPPPLLPPTDETTSDETTSDETTSDETTSDETTSDETTSDETTSDETTSDETTSDETTSDETTTTDEEEQQGSESESKDNTPGETPYMQIPSTSDETTSDETPSTETPSEGIPYPPTPPSTETPSTETPSTETPSTETPSTETPSTETPSTETPSTETPSTETPSTETPSEGIPYPRTPPSTETPSTETPSTETPSKGGVVYEEALTQPPSADIVRQAEQLGLTPQQLQERLQGIATTLQTLKDKVQSQDEQSDNVVRDFYTRNLVKDFDEINQPSNEASQLKSNVEGESTNDDDDADNS
jgi:hypothetical protein